MLRTTEQISHQGALSIEQLTELAAQQQLDTVLVAFTDHYGRLLGKRLDIDFFLNHHINKGVGACDYLFTVDMEMNPVPGYQFANWEKGFGDMHMLADLSTLRVASWLEKTAVVLANVVDSEQQPITVAPRNILRAQLLKLDAQGYQIKTATELEYHLFQNSYEEAAKQDYYDLRPVGWYSEDYHVLQGTREEVFNGAARRYLKYSGIQVENSKGEWGVGQHELNIRYADTLTMADHHVILKQCLKETADQVGMSVTFMAKPTTEGAGSSCHVHVSLWQGEKNVFFKESDLFRWFLGGWIKHAPEMMVFYAPTVNSYKRYQAQSWAPTGLAWSDDNRTAGFRIIGEDESSYRIECRIPGADCNPYLALAAVLASGLDGIQHKIEPTAKYEGDVYAADKLPTLPTNLLDATTLFRESKFARLSFGDDVVDHYTHFYTNEQQAFEGSVTDWERQRYFERI